MFPSLYKNSKSHWNRSIHSLIYNALKTLSEMNQPLFDECSSKYKTEMASKVQAVVTREATWAKLEAMAKKNPLSKTIAILHPKMPTPLPDIKMKEPSKTPAYNAATAATSGTGSGGDAGVIRRKSILPHDPNTRRALEQHQQDGSHPLSPT